MEDSRIIELYWQRDEAAIAETQKKYGRYCFAIADGILHSAEDAEECVSDTLSGAWNAMPPHRPAMLSTFLGKITRRSALKKLRAQTAEKRGGGEVSAVLDELEECVPSPARVDETLQAKELVGVINAFLQELRADERNVFLRRYWYLDSVGAIASRFGFSESKVKMMLKRTRDRLAQRLEKEDIRI